MKVYALVVVLSSFILLGGCASTERDTGKITWYKYSTVLVPGTGTCTVLRSTARLEKRNLNFVSSP